MCASGKLAQGIILANLRTPGQESDYNSRKFRFMEGGQADDINGLLSIYNSGLKINSHMYCVPYGLNGGGDIQVIQCNSDFTTLKH